MSKYLIDRYRDFESYVPGEQPQDKKYVKLNTNESPYPASKEVLGCVTDIEMSSLCLYSDPECMRLRKAIAGLYNVKSENVLCSNGSDDILNFAFTAFSGGDIKAVFPDITYGFYEVLTAFHGIDTVRPPLKDDFTIDVNDYIGCGGFIAIANPNAPTGIYLKISDIEKIVQSNPDSVVLIDEAYVDFGNESAVSLTKKYKNLLVVMTFSKSRSLAGARLGFAIGDSELIADMNKLRYATNPYSVNRLSLVCGEQAILSDGYYRDNCKKIVCERERFTAELRKLGFHVPESGANFVFAESDVISGNELYVRLREKGVLVRHFTAPKIANFNRITIGTPEQMNTLLTAVKEILDEVRN